MKKANTNKMLLATVVAVITVLFGFAAVGTSVVGPGVVPPPPPEPTPEPEYLSVYVDIKPGSCPNPLNVKSGGVLPVAVLGTGEFDVAGIDVSTIRLTLGDAGVAPIRYSYEDVATPYEGAETCGCHELTGDGYTDLTLKFDRQELVETLELTDEAGTTIPVTVAGSLLDGTVIEGSDCIWVLAKGKK
ncbi:MAG: hypothetical protein ACNYVW_05020 [Methanosarcinales archaeon]